MAERCLYAMGTKLTESQRRWAILKGYPVPWCAGADPDPEIDPDPDPEIDPDPDPEIDPFLELLK